MRHYNENFNLFKTLFYKDANNIAIIFFLLYFNFRINKFKKILVTTILYII